MDAFYIEAEKREVSGKGAIRRLKRQGLIPGIFYNKEGNMPISLDKLEVNNILNKHGDSVFFNVKVDGKSINAKVQEVQRDSFNQEVKHIDLMPTDNKYLH